jgi:hypothetical protein
MREFVSVSVFYILELPTYNSSALDDVLLTQVMDGASRDYMNNIIV